MIISLTTTAGGAGSIGYGLTKKRDIKQADNILSKQNENVMFVRADHLKVNSVLGTPSPSDIYRQMQLRQQTAGMKRKDKFWNIGCFGCNRCTPIAHGHNRFARG